MDNVQSHTVSFTGYKSSQRRRTKRRVLFAHPIYRCGQCPFKARSLAHLDQHIAEVHTRGGDEPDEDFEVA
jgi:hypothetical protein